MWVIWDFYKKAYMSTADAVLAFDTEARAKKFAATEYGYDTYEEVKQDCCVEVRALTIDKKLVQQAIEWIESNSEEDCWCWDEVDPAPDAPAPRVGTCLLCKLRTLL